MIKLTENFTKSKKMFIVMGAGGTGGWLIPFLSKLDNQTIIIDGDVVEKKNIKRQNFFDSDINRYKSEVFGERFTNLITVNEYISDTDLLEELFEIEPDSIPVLIGCLDNNGTRKIAHDIFKNDKYKNIAWIDAGNAERHGQVYIAIKDDGEVKYPSPLDIDPVLANIDKSERRPDQISCAEVSESAPQNITANATSAVLLFDIVNIINSSKIVLFNYLGWDTRTMSFEKKEIFE